MCIREQKNTLHTGVLSRTLSENIVQLQQLRLPQKLSHPFEANATDASLVEQGFVMKRPFRVATRLSALQPDFAIVLQCEVGFGQHLDE